MWPEPVAEAGEEYAAFKVEQRGIDLIPDAEKKMKPAGLFWLWAGGVFNVEFLFYGTLIMTFGLSVLQAILAIIIGNLTYALLGFASLQGPKTGTTAFMVSRAPFGKNGNRLVALFNWGTQVGFEIEGVYFVVATVLLLFARGHTTLNGPGKVGIIIVAVLVQMALPLLGHATISKIFRYMAYIFIVFFVVLAVFTFQRVHLSAVPRPPGDVRGLDHRAGDDHLGRRPRLDGERERLLALPAARHARVQDVLGGGARRRDPLDPAGDPRRARLHGHHQDGRPGRARHPADVRQLVRGAVPDLRHLPAARDQHDGPVLLRRHAAGPRRAGQALGAVLIDSVVCGVVVGIILFHGNFYADFAGFLLYIIVWLSAWFGVFITD